MIATRRSPLALWQAKEVQRRFQASGRSVRLALITTTGDRILETCSGRADLEEILAPLNDRGTELCVSAERAVGRHMDAGCSQPFAAYAHLSAGVMHLEAAYQGRDDSEPVFATASAPVSQVEQALGLGEEVAGRLRRA